MTHKLEDNYNCRDSPPGERGPGPVSGSLAWGSCTEKCPLKLWLWRPQASLLARGLWETETPPLKGAHKISYSGTQGQSSNLKRVWLFTMTYRKKTFILYTNTNVYTHKAETNVLWNNLSCPHIFYSMLFSQNPNAVYCPLHWLLHPLMSPPEVWKPCVWFSKPSYIISS